MNPIESHNFVKRKVSKDRTISVHGMQYDVADIPWATPGRLVFVDLVMSTDMSVALAFFDQGKGVDYELAPLIERNAAGFRRDAPILGAERVK